MKHLFTALVLLGLTFPCLNAQTPNGQNAREIFNASPDSRNGDVITFLTFTLILNGEHVTRTNHLGNPDWTRVYDVDGVTFTPWHALEVGTGIVLLGNTGGGYDNCLVKVDYNGNPQWARRYSRRFEDMIVSINGNILLANTQNGRNFMEYSLFEVDPYNGQVMQYSMIEIPDFPNSHGQVKGLAHNGVWYLGIVEASGQTISITNDAQLNPDRVHRHVSGSLGHMDIRDLKRSKKGDFYVLGIDKPNNQLFFGKMSINQWFSDMRTYKLEGGLDLDLSGNGPLMVESPNWLPTYHGPFPGTITQVPNNQAFTFTAIARDQNSSNDRALLVQYDENWQNNYSQLYTFPDDVGQPNLVKRNNHHVTMVTTVDAGSGNRLFENRVADDFFDCFSTFRNYEEREIEIENPEIDYGFEEDEFTSEEADLNYYTVNSSATPACPNNKAQANALDQAVDAFQIVAYPNPSHGDVTLEGLEGARVDIFDLMGRTIRSFPEQGQSALEVTDLPRGTYLVRAIRGNAQRQIKISVR